jgi:hypothetical protein
MRGNPQCGVPHSSMQYSMRVEYEMSRAFDKNLPWYMQPSLQARLVVEHEAVRARFPGFVLKKDTQGDLYWIGYLHTNFHSRYRVKVSYPPNYPHVAPVAFVVQPALQPSPHRYGTDPHGALCLFHPATGHSQSFDPARTTAATVIAWAAEWLACYEVFQRTNEWVSAKPQHFPESED